MREFNINIKESLQSGLRPHPRVDRNRPFLTEAYNLMCSEYGLESFKPVVDPFDGGLSVNFPFPQLLVGKGVTLLLNENKIYEVDDSSSIWTIRSIDTYKTDKKTLDSIISGGIWHFVDMKDYWYLFNGESVVFKVRDLDLPIEERVVTNSDVKVNTATNFKGRVVMGGFDPSSLWGETWEIFFDKWMGLSDSPIKTEFDDIGSNYVFWSSIGGGDFPLWFFYPEEAMRTWTPGVTEYTQELQSSYFLDRLRRNEWGFMPMPWQGTVLALKQLGENIVVYGDEGITLLVPTQGGGDIPATFGLRNIMSIGIASRGSVGGNEQNHIFIDNSGVLWSLGADLKITRLNYQEYFADMLGTEILISYNPQDNQYYISNRDKSFLLDKGLTEINQCVTSCYSRYGEIVGVFNLKRYDSGDLKNHIDNSIRLATSTLDFNIIGKKTVTGVSLNLRYPNKVKVAYDYRLTKSGEFKRTRFVGVNSEGNAELRVNALDFRIIIEASDYENFELDNIEVRFQPDDNRYRRGTNVNASNT